MSSSLQKEASKSEKTVVIKLDFVGVQGSNGTKMQEWH